MTSIMKPDPAELAKWRAQAYRAATHIKSTNFDKESIKVGFVFNDAIVKVAITQEVIRQHPVQQLADYIYNLVVTATQTGGSA